MPDKTPKSRNRSPMHQAATLADQLKVLDNRTRENEERYKKTKAELQARFVTLTESVTPEVRALAEKLLGSSIP